MAKQIVALRNFAQESKNSRVVILFLRVVVQKITSQISSLRLLNLIYRYVLKRVLWYVSSTKEK
jgi:hypothetical protein